MADTLTGGNSNDVVGAGPISQGAGGTPAQNDGGQGQVSVGNLANAAEVAKGPAL